MNVSSHEKQLEKLKGFTLIELMIAMMLGLIVIGAAISIYISTVASSSSTIKSARLNYDLESSMSLMLNDIRRAGYWGGAADGVAINNPFTNANPNLLAPLSSSITNITINDTGDCILYSYDADESGINTPNDTTDDIGANEFYGFKLEDNSIKIRTSGTATNDCDNGTWENFIDESLLTIESVEFSFEAIDAGGVADDIANGNSRCWNQTQGQSDDTDADICIANAIDGDYLIQNRMVNIKLTGELINDANVVKSLSGTVEVRNNRICTRSAAENCP